MRVVSSIDGGPTVTRRYDELGRELSEGVIGLGGTEYTTYTTYTPFGGVATRSRAQDSFNTDNRVEYDYDPLGRITFTAEPGGGRSANCYRGLVACVIDADDNARCVEKDHRGRVLFAGDPARLNGEGCIDFAATFASTPVDERSGVAYTYGPFSRLERAIRMPEATLVAELTSDRLGRLASRTDIGSGTTSFTHTPFGELETAADSNATVTYEYDKLGRRRFRRVDPVASGEPNTSTEWSWRDDLQNRLDFDTAGGIETTVDYDELGRTNRVTQSVDGEDFVASVDEFDDYGRPRFLSYPGDIEVRVENVYDGSSGMLQEVKAAPSDGGAPRPSYWKLDDLDEFGQVTSETFGNGLVTTRTYHDYTGLPKTIVTAADGETPVQDIAYTFHDSRNLESVTDANGISQSYEYDAFGRIDKVFEGGNAVADLGYTSFGSIEINAKAWSYGYDPASPHSVDTIEDEDANVSSFEYNANGTLRHRSAGALPELNVDYTDFDKPKKVWGADEQDATTYDYNADQAKVAKRTPDGATHYFGRLYYRETSTATGDVTHHYLVSNGQSVVAEIVRTVPTNGPADQLTLYHHGDHLGSVQVVTGADGTVSDRRQFGLFGESETTPSAASKLGYTGHWQEPEHGLIDMGGRFYDPAVGQFLSSDPIIGSPLRSESFNLKAYVANNPLRFIDPSGFQMCDELSRCGFGGAPNSSPGGGFEGAASLPTFSPYSPGYSEAKYTSGAASRGPAASGGEKALFVGVGAGAAIGIGAGATKLAVLCIGTGPGCAAVLAGLVVVGTGYAVYDLVWDGGAVEIVDAFSHFETRHDALVVGATLAGVGQLVAKPITNIATRRLAGGAFLTTYEETTSTRVMSGMGDDVADAVIVREIAHGEGIGAIVEEVGTLTRSTTREHAVLSLADGRRVIVVGGEDGIDFARMAVRRILGHSHPPGSLPGASVEDAAAIDYYFQRSSWLLEVGSGSSQLSRIRLP